MGNLALGIVGIVLLGGNLCAAAAPDPTPYFGVNQDFVWTDDKAIYWFPLKDGPAYLNDGTDSMGLISGDGRRRLSFETYKHLAAAGRNLH